MPAGGRLRVVRGDDQEAVHAGGKRRARERDRMMRVVGARVCDHGMCGADLGDDRLEQHELLVVGHGRPLAGRPADDDPVRAGVDEVAGDPPGRVQVDRSVAGKGRDHGGQQVSQGCTHLAKSTAPGADLLLPRRSRQSITSSPRHEPGRQLADPAYRQQHPGRERFPRGGVVADRQRLPEAAEDDLLVGDQPGQADARRSARHRAAELPSQGRCRMGRRACCRRAAR